jgi:hypothetical protein
MPLPALNAGAGNRRIYNVLHDSMRLPHKKPTALSQRINGLLDRRPTRLVTVAIANKLARIAWAVMARGERFRNEGAPVPAAA